jgi:hypothetical protein
MRSFNLQEIQTVDRFSASWSDVEFMFCGIYRLQQQAKSQVCDVQTGYASTKRRSGNVCLR